MSKYSFYRCFKKFALISLSFFGLLILHSCDQPKTEDLISLSSTDPALMQSKQSNTPLKIAFISEGSIKNNRTSYSHNQARLHIQAKYGEKIETGFFESVTNSSEVERIIKKLIRFDYHVIVATSFAYDAYITPIAQNYPHIRFIKLGGIPLSKNQATFNARSHEGVYLAGLMAGHLTNSNILGVVGTAPSAESLRIMNSYLLGAQRVNPQVKLKLIWIHSQANPNKENKAARILISQGADILFSNTQSRQILETAQTYDKRAIDWNSEEGKRPLRSQIASINVDWTPYYDASIKKILNGEWEPDRYDFGVKEGDISFKIIAKDIPNKVQDSINEATNELKKNPLTIWQPPIFDIHNKKILAENTEISAELLQNMNFYLQGIEVLNLGNTSFNEKLSE